MKYKELVRNINEDVKDSFISYGRVVNYLQDDTITIDGVKENEQFSSLEEAKEYCKNQYISSKLEEEIIHETYDVIENKIARIINEHYNVKVTDTLIETYIELSASKEFTVDPVVRKIRKLNKYDPIVEGKLDYRLNDGSVVAISHETQKVLNNLLENQNEIVAYMRENRDNFMYVIEQIEE